MRHRAAPRSVTPLVRLQAALIVAVLYAGVVVSLTAQRESAPVAGTAAATSPYAPPAPGATKPAPAARPIPAPAPNRSATPTRRPSTARPAAAPQAPAGKRWLPEGTGMWTYLWDRTEGGKARLVVRRAEAMGLTHLYVRTGTRKGGFDGGPVLDRLLPETRGTNIKVIAWDFPMLTNPHADAARLAAAARYRSPVPGSPRVAAVAPDIETPAEGTRLSAVAVDRYYRELRRLLPPDVAILATVPWPSEKRIGFYPYEITARHADAIVPMAYWINRDPVVVTRQTMARLQRYGKPVMPVGQAYDPRIDVPTLRLTAPSGRQVAAFVKTAREMGAPSVSLWVWNTATREQWGALSSSRALFRPGAPAVARPAGLPAPRKPAPRPATPPRRAATPPSQAQRAD